ncbi:hypothetical protein O3G_MSEX014594 [Manduca sexta]|uniref:DUF4817 domain-containing protein n=1 Tax=Manduca sexta TaxID=7130 RepID=A0A921ZVL4_MANSE|nr:hypothetical protein O3G_MSEX014594 [Manduca sexta]
MPSIIYTSSEYTDMILIYGECHGNAALALRTYREKYGNSRSCPRNARTIVLAVQRIRENKPIVPHQERVPSRQIPVAREEQILEYFDRNPTTSLHRAARRFRVCHRTVHAILKNNKWKPYKFRKVQALLPRDLPVRNNNCQWLLHKVDNDSNFLSNVMWTDDSTFTRNGIWNRQNRRYWSLENPHVYRESEHQYRFSLNVWAGIHKNQIIGPIFIDGTLTAVKFIELLRGPVAEYTDQLPLTDHRQLWYQLDGAPPHSVVSSRERLTEMFGQQWIGRFGPAMLFSK